VRLLEVPAARLYYETRGIGPLLVMIPGASGDARIFAGVGDYLAEQPDLDPHEARSPEHREQPRRSRPPRRIALYIP